MFVMPGGDGFGAGYAAAILALIVAPLAAALFAAGSALGAVAVLRRGDRHWISLASLAVNAIGTAAFAVLTIALWRRF